MDDVKKHILITGRPGVGKTTLIKKLSDALHHHRPVGFYTREIRKGVIREGFKLIGLDGTRSLLAHTDFAGLFQVGISGCKKRSNNETFLSTAIGSPLL